MAAIMDVFKITDESEAMRALETVRAAEASRASGQTNPDFAFITPALLAIGRFHDKEIGELMRAITIDGPDAEETSGEKAVTSGSGPSCRHPLLIWNITEKEFLPRTAHMLDSQVIDVPWKTPGQFTHSPTLESILLLCYSLKSWLDIGVGAGPLLGASVSADQLETVVAVAAAAVPHLGAVHCSNGKTRTGILMACLLKYTGAYATSTAAFDFFCQARAKSKPVLSPSYCIFFNNFDLIVDRHGQFPNPSHCVHLTSVSISGLPVDELPSVEVWDSCRGLVFASHARAGGERNDSDECADLVPSDQCTWSDQFGDGLFSASCDVLSDFAIICRFGGEHARIRDKTTLIYKYQNNAAFLETGADGDGASTTLTLRRADVDVNPEYSDSIDVDSFVMKITFDGQIDAPDSTTTASDVAPCSPGARSAGGPSPTRPRLGSASITSAAYSFIYLPPHSKGSFDRGLEEISRFHTVPADPSLQAQLVESLQEDSERRYARVALQLTNNSMERALALVQHLTAKSDEFEIITELVVDAELSHEDDEDYRQAQVTVSEGEDGCKWSSVYRGLVVCPGGVWSLSVLISCYLVILFVFLYVCSHVRERWFS